MSWRFTAGLSGAHGDPGNLDTHQQVSSDARVGTCRDWLDAEQPEAEEADAAPDKRAGRALKCRVCDGKLILNALALRQHVASKRHARNCKGGLCTARAQGV